MECIAKNILLHHAIGKDCAPVLADILSAMPGEEVDLDELNRCALATKEYFGIKAVVTTAVHHTRAVSQKIDSESFSSQPEQETTLGPELML